MSPNEYQKLANRTNDDLSGLKLVDKALDTSVVDIGSLINGCLGLAGETGEALDIVKKWVFHRSELDIEHFKKELGDVMWYMATICTAMGFELEEILEMNIEKLKKRYPDGFNVERANNREVGDI